MIVDANSDLNVYRETTEDGTRSSPNDKSASSSDERQSCCAPVPEVSTLLTETCCGIKSASQGCEVDNEGGQTTEIDELSNVDLNEYAGTFQPPFSPCTCS